MSSEERDTEKDIRMIQASFQGLPAMVLLADELGYTNWKEFLAYVDDLKSQPEMYLAYLVQEANKRSQNNER